MPKNKKYEEIIAENERYAELKAEIIVMTVKQKQSRLDDLLSEIFIMANSFAGKEPAGVASYLHESANNIMRVQKIFDGSVEPGINPEFVLRAMGIGMGATMADLLVKDELYAEDLENESNEKLYKKVTITHLNCDKYLISIKGDILFENIDTIEEAIKKAEDISESYSFGGKMDIVKDDVEGGLL